MVFFKETSPHLRRKDTLSMMMLDVLIALIPCVIASIVYYGLSAVRNILISLAVMEISEFVFNCIKNKVPYDGNKHSFKENWESIKKNLTPVSFLTPAVSAVIFALIMPAKTSTPYMIYVALILGALFGIIIGKLVFGGTGKNIFNPAAVGMVFSKLCFGSTYVYESTSLFDVSVSGTPLSSSLFSLGDKVFNFNEYSLLDLFLGKIPGVIGETCKLAILISLVYLLIRHTIDFRITLANILSFALIMLFVGVVLHAKDNSINPFYFMTYELLSGGLLFGAVFMSTDPVTSPITSPSRYLYGALIGSLCALIRLFAALPEGMVFSIMIANMVTSFLDWDSISSPKFNFKQILAIALTVLIPLLIAIWASCVEVF